MAVQYPRRELVGEPFGDQMDTIEKRLIEQQNMPTMYMNYRRKPVKQQYQQYQQFPQQQHQHQHYHSQQQQQHEYRKYQLLAQPVQPVLPQQQQQQQLAQPTISPPQFQASAPSTYNHQQQLFQPFLTDFAVSDSPAYNSNGLMSQKQPTTFDPFATNYTQSIWGSRSGSNEKSVATVWG